MERALEVWKKLTGVARAYHDLPDFHTCFYNLDENPGNSFLFLEYRAWQKSIKNMEGIYKGQRFKQLTISFVMTLSLPLYNDRFISLTTS